MRSSTSASQACGSTSLSLAVTIRLLKNAARWPPRSEPAKEPRLAAQGQAAQCPLRSVVRQAHAAVVEEAGEGQPAVVNGHRSFLDCGHLKFPGLATD